MRRLTVAFLALFAASVLAACGDMGNHFGEFRQAPPPPQTPTSITANMPIIPGPNIASAKLPLYITAYEGNQALQQGTNLVNPIVITTNYVGYVMFSSPTGPAGSKYKSLNLTATPNNITVYYKRPPVKFCLTNGAPDAVITIYNHDAKPQFVSVDLSGCSTTPITPTPSPSPAPTPTPSPSPTASPTP
jgi:hypothetical protein